MKRFLVFGMTENPGGVESFLITYYRHLDRSKIQFDFLCNTLQPVAYEKELEDLGGRVFHIQARKDGYCRFQRDLEQLFREHASQWDGVWVNVSSLANIDYLKIAKKYGIQKRIIHSHTSQNMDGFLRGLLHKWNIHRVKKYATDFWACSEEAGIWFYGKKRKSVIIHNAIDINQFCFDERKRSDIRDRYHLENQFVIGHVGRLHFEKNQEFVLEVFGIYFKSHSDSRLVFIGQGEDEKKLKEQTEKMGLSGVVFFTGVQNDIQGWLSAFDLFLFPSRFEGLSIAALEAQANGLPIIASKDALSEKARVTNNLQFLSLNHNAQDWALMIEKKRYDQRETSDHVRQAFAEKGYDINIEVKRLERLLTD